MPYRLIGIDLDGTLLDPDKRITPATCRAIERAMDAGVLVVPATGRSWHRAHHGALCHLPSMPCGVFLDGATVWDIQAGCIDTCRCMDLAALHELTEAIAHEPVAWDVCRLTPDGRDYDYAIFGRGPVAAARAEWERVPMEAHRLSNDTALDGRRCLRALLRTDAASALDRAQRIIAERRLPLHTIRWSSPASPLADYAPALPMLQLHSPAADKWAALCDIAARHDIPRRQIATIGDEINDVMMVREAGCGVAMGNAIEPVKAVADCIAPANSDNGVAYAIDRLLGGDW